MGAFWGTQRHGDTEFFLFVYVSEILYFVLVDKEEDTPLRLILGDIASFRVTRIEKSQFSTPKRNLQPATRGCVFAYFLGCGYLYKV